MRAGLFLLCLGLTGSCASFPEIDAAMGAGARDAPFPTLAPIDGLLDRAAAVTIDGSEGERLSARAAWLRSRARALQAPVLTRAERRRLLEAVERYSG